MPLRLWSTIATVAALAVCAFAVTASGAPGPPKVRAHPLITGVYPQIELNADPSQAGREVKALGGKMVRILTYWSSIAPRSLPASWDPTNPTDPNYVWTTLDAQVKAVVAQGLTPYVDVLVAPQWAQGNPPSDDLASYKPVPSMLGDFATALARRYGGSVLGLPRVRYFQVWDEPNLSIYLKPQLVDKTPVSPSVYRTMVNAFAKSVHAVHGDNVVIAGGLAPFRDLTPDVLKQNQDWGPLAFMRDLLCLSTTLKKTCSSKVAFDAWGMNPYTSGGPNHKAELSNDVSLGDLDKVDAMLVAAQKNHTIVAPHGVGFWVTEFSWDSRPPDPRGVPISTLRRWVPEALYTMWKAGVSVVTWFTLQDAPLSKSPYQSGFYTASATGPGTLKSYAQGFRFPFVAYPATAGGLTVWGRSPTSRAGSVQVEQRVGSTWKRLARLRANGFGIFTGSLRAQGRGAVRAKWVASGETSLPYALKEIPDKVYVPFGFTTPLEPSKK